MPTFIYRLDPCPGLRRTAEPSNDCRTVKTPTIKNVEHKDEEARQLGNVKDRSARDIDLPGLRSPSDRETSSAIAEKQIVRVVLIRYYQIVLAVTIEVSRGHNVLRAGGKSWNDHML